MWHDFGAGAVAAIETALLAADYPIDVASTFVGEPILGCKAGVSVGGWISGLDTEVDPSNCVWIPPVLWTIRVLACIEPLDGAAAWDEILQLAWCAVTDYVRACVDSGSSTLACESVSFRGMNVNTPTGGQVSADYVWRVEDGCGD